MDIQLPRTVKIEWDSAPREEPLVIHPPIVDIIACRSAHETEFEESYTATPAAEEAADGLREAGDELVQLIQPRLETVILAATPGFRDFRAIQNLERQFSEAGITVLHSAHYIQVANPLFYHPFKNDALKERLKPVREPQSYSQPSLMASHVAVGILELFQKNTAELHSKYREFLASVRNFPLWKNAALRRRLLGKRLRIVCFMNAELPEAFARHALGGEEMLAHGQLLEIIPAEDAEGNAYVSKIVLWPRGRNKRLKERIVGGHVSTLV